MAAKTVKRKVRKAPKAKVAKRATRSKATKTSSVKKAVLDTYKGKTQKKKATTKTKTTKSKFVKPRKVELVPAVKPAASSARTLILRDVYEVTPQVYKERAKFAHIQTFHARRDMSGNIPKGDTGRRVILAETYTTHDHNGNPKTKATLHYQIIVGYSTQLKDRLWTNKCKVSCSCEDFLFTDEVALHKRGNADIYFSNGEDPVIKNPKMRPQICKHLIAVLKEIRSKRL